MYKVSRRLFNREFSSFQRLWMSTSLHCLHTTRTEICLYRLHWQEHRCKY